MKNKGCLRYGFWIGLLALVLLCIAAGGLAYFQARARAFNSRPLVLIHAPVNHEQARVGDGVIVHATARADNGLRRVELWADDSFVDGSDAPEGSAPTTLILSSSWIAYAAGNHVLTVRAIASDGTAGQATVMVESLAQEGADAGTHTVEEGETIESIAEEYGTTPEEVAASNPGIEPGGIVPGEELILPGGEEPPSGGGGESPVPEEGGEEPPVPGEDPPGAPGSAFELMYLLPLESIDFGAGEPTDLRVEFLRIGASATSALEGLHCYVGAGEIPPRWIPDADGDQATDESFVITDSESDDGVWSLAADMTGEDALTISWPHNRDLPISVSCVGIAGGGTEALELGLWEGSIAPDYWTGIELSGFGDGVDGGFDIIFRITHTGGGGGGIPLWLDPDMTPPTNARLDDRRISLRWDYEPRADEEPIDGFRVYLNGNLQWVEPTDSRESMLPYEWFNPPCGTTYNFSVTAYRVGLPDGPESFPAVVILEQPQEDCAREVLITFLTLETFDLGGDGNHEDRDGDVGPPYGTFFANEQQITFDGGTLERGGSLDSANGFTHNTVYNLGELSANPSWNFNGSPVALLVAIPEGGAFEFGFRIMDEDSGRCHDSDDSGCDDLICEGLSMIYEEESVANELDSQHEGSLTSEDGRCRVTYQWGPAAGSPVGSGVEGWEPLPWISLEDMEVDESTGQARLHIRNTGTATWPWRDLIVELQSRDGVSLGIYTWPAFVLEPGQRATLEHPDMRLSAPFDACVLIDPYDDVLEEPECSGMLFHNPICTQLPDLVITNVEYDAGGRLVQVSVQNQGEGAIRNRTIELNLVPPSGPAAPPRESSEISLEPWETTLFSLSVNESLHSAWVDGYTVTVDPHDTIVESDNDNNSFVVQGVKQLSVVLDEIHFPLEDYERGRATFTFSAYVVSGGSRSRVVHWVVEEDSDGWSGGHSVDAERWMSPDLYSEWFIISGDQVLELSITVDPARGRDPISWTETYTAEDLWGSGESTSNTYCSISGPDGVHVNTVSIEDTDTWMSFIWMMRYEICRIEE